VILHDLPVVAGMTELAFTVDYIEGWTKERYVHEVKRG
jgi:hypothetical protein